MWCLFNIKWSLQIVSVSSFQFLKISQILSLHTKPPLMNHLALKRPKVHRTISYQLIVVLDNVPIAGALQKMGIGGQRAHEFFDCTFFNWILRERHLASPLAVALLVFSTWIFHLLFRVIYNFTLFSWCLYNSFFLHLQFLQFSLFSALLLLLMVFAG